MAATELLRPAFLTVLFIVLASSDISEDVSVSYNVDLHPSAERFVIEYESMDRGRYRRQATGLNSTTTPPSTSQAPNTQPPTTKVQSSAAPQTAGPTVPNTSTPRPNTTPRPTPPSTTPHTHSAPPTTTPRPSSGSSTPEPKVSEDFHQYYQSLIIPNGVQDIWIDLSTAKKHATLSKSHRTAVTINLGFKFRFYGHNITNVTIATGGFLYASPFLHQWLTATQYIAPLMANFDLRIGDDSDVFYDDFGDKFAVQWRNVVLKDQNSTGSFDFQVQLHADGTIKFLYKQLPIQVASISSTNHPVKIGLSDAFYIDTYIKEKGIRRRTIYEYHRVSFHGDQIDQGTVIVMKPLPTCNVITDCRDCVNHEEVAFECKWCGAVGRCSDGIDWHRSQWINKGCSKLAVSNETLCDVTTTTKSTTTQTTIMSTTPLPPTTTKKPTTIKTTRAQSSTASATANGPARSKCGGVGSGDDSRNDTDCLTTSLDTSLDNTSLTATNQSLSSSTNSFSPSTTASSGNALSTSSRTTTNRVVTTFLTTSHPPRELLSSTKMTTTGISERNRINRPLNKDVPYKITRTEKTQEGDMVEGTICDQNVTDGVCRGREEAFPTGAVVAVVLILLVVFGGIGVWIFYAYTHPTSASGMWLMEHRPSQMKSKIANIKFWKSSTPAGTKYAVESTA